jgi:ATP-dependent DNA ligase
MVMALMLATLTDRRDFGDDWLLERKFDGERCVGRKVGSERGRRQCDPDE